MNPSKNVTKFLTRVSVIISLFAAGIASPMGWEGKTDDTAWIELKNAVEERSERLTELIARADANKITTDYASVSKVVVDLFLKYAQYDRDHPEEIQEAYDNLWWTRKIPDLEYSKRLPFDELQGCLDVANHAIVELQEQFNKKVVLSPAVDFRTGRFSIGNGSFLRDGEPVFPSTFTWMPDEDDLLMAFGRMGGVAYSLNDLEKDGTIKESELKADTAKAVEMNARNIGFQQFFISHGAPAWMQKNYPGILNGGRNFVRYDTDSPVIRNNLEKLLSQYLPEVSRAAGTQPRMHLLANEPNFATRTGGWQAEKGVSDYTRERYKDWLAGKYSTISKLNAVYGTSYRNFDQARDALAMPIDPEAPETLQGGPVWYDWCRFNMDRINNWFTFLKKGVQANDPLAAPVTIKVLGRQLSTEWRDDGMDMEYLAGLMDVLGADTHTIPTGMTNANLNGEQEWLDHYALEWVMQSMLLDFYKSLYPEKAYYDSEWHGFSTQRWVDFSIERNYIRSALWLGFSHGMNAIQSWVWGRKDDGSFLNVNSNFIGEVLTQPTALDAYGRTMKELNAHAQAVTGLAQQDRQFYIYYCEEAAIQDLGYIPEMENVYEALKLLNLRVGFTTPSRISGLPPEAKTVIVPPTRYISDGSLAALTGFARSGGKIVIIGESESFLKTELGMNRPKQDGFVPFARINPGEAKHMVQALSQQLKPLIPVFPVQVTILDDDLNPAYGVLVSQNAVKSGHKTNVLLINTSNGQRIVNLDIPGDGKPAIRDLLTQRNLPDRIKMAPCDVLLLGVDW